MTGSVRWLAIVRMESLREWQGHPACREGAETSYRQKMAAAIAWKMKMLHTISVEDLERVCKLLGIEGDKG